MRKRIIIAACIAAAFFAVLGLACGNPYLSAGVCALAALVAVCSFLAPASSAMRTELGSASRGMKACIVVVAAAEIAACTLPMGLNPIWNGEVPEHRDQYERIAEAFLDGSLSFEYDDVDERLAQMENPYDPKARARDGIEVHWDHAYYQGRYYLYFGVVPAILVFVPFRALTGASLATYHATQLFCALAVCGLYALFWTLGRRFFAKMPFGAYLALAAGMSAASVWFAVEAPALYCTAITAGIAFMVWSLFFFCKAFLCEPPLPRMLAAVFFGAMCGALAFGCRPTIALCNLAVIAMLASYLWRTRPAPGKAASLFAVGLSPYLLVACGLMWYNAARFGNPFEFGQAYQMTLADQHQYSLAYGIAHFPEKASGILDALVGIQPLSDEFPYVGLNGIFICFPMLFAVFTLVMAAPRAALAEREGLSSLAIGLALSACIAMFFEIAWSPMYDPRYCLDFNYLLGILCFIAFGAWFSACPAAKRPAMGFAVALCSVVVCLTCAFLFFIPHDWNLTQVYPELLDKLKHFITLGLR